MKSGSIHYDNNGVSVQVRDHEEMVSNCFRANEVCKAEILNQTQVTANVAKSSSLKKLKKDSAMKKSMNNYGHINSQNELMHSHLIDPVRGLYETYQYLNSKEILLKPDEIIASVV